MKNLLKRKELLIVVFLTIIGGFLRFYNLNWGDPFYFHPDERNIASSVTQLNLFNQMNPHFFAYGSFPIYAIYSIGVIWNLFSFNFPALTNVSFGNAILISRFLSAFLSTLLIPFLYLLGKKLKNQKAGIIAAFLSTFSVGFIQFSHFGTFEIWITFLSLIIFYLSLLFLHSNNRNFLLIIGAVLGILMATKISNFPVILYALIFIIISAISKNHRLFSTAKNFFFNLLIVFLPMTVMFFLTSPFILLDFSSFLSSLKYESSVALGTLPVFYTEEFFNTTPVIFQFAKIYPFLFNPILTIIFIPSFFYICFEGIKNRNSKYLILATIYLLLFLPQAFLFAKWTRYVVPTLPFMYLIIAIALEDFSKSKAASIKHIALIIIIFINIVFGFSYFVTAFVKPDTRIEASLWAKKNIPNNTRILSEVYDLGITAFNPYFPNIKLVNFYEIENNKAESQSLSQLNNYNYIIIPSQRLLKPRVLQSNLFPKGNIFYKSLLSEALGFKKIYETQCDIFCKIVYLGNPVFNVEETANVFDRPTVFIFKKGE